MPAEAIAAPPAPTPAPPPTPVPPSPTPAPAQPASDANTAEQKATAEIESILNRGAKKKEQAAAPITAGDNEFEEVIKPNRKAWKAYEGFKSRTTGELNQLKEKLKTLEAKPPTVEGDKKIADLEKKISDFQKVHEEVLRERDETKKSLAEIAYERSEEFKRDYDDKWQLEYRTSLDNTLKFPVIIKGGEGEADRFRAATQKDFDNIRKADSTYRRKLATELFGENGTDVLDYVKELDRIDRSAREAIARYTQDYEKKSKEKQVNSQLRLSKLEQRRQEIRHAIEDGMPDLSLKHHESDPDAAKALQNGYEMAESGLKELLGFNDESDPESHAQRLETFRSLVASASLYALQNDRLTGKVTELETELAKYRKSDPGATTPTPPSEKNEPDEVGTVEEEAKKFKRA